MVLLFFCTCQVALVHGISMGGGASLMVPMKFSVVTEKTVSIWKLLKCYFHSIVQILLISFVLHFLHVMT